MSTLPAPAVDFARMSARPMMMSNWLRRTLSVAAAVVSILLAGGAVWIMTKVAAFHLSFWLGLAGAFVLVIAIGLGFLAVHVAARSFARRSRALGFTLVGIAFAVFGGGLIGIVVVQNNLGSQPGFEFNADKLWLGVLDAVILSIILAISVVMNELSSKTKKAK